MRCPHSLWLLIAATTAAVAAPSTRVPAPAPIPIETFFRAQDYSAVRLSPDGRYISFLTTLGTGHVGIALMEVATGKVAPLVGGKDEDYRFYFWKGPTEVVFGGDYGGNESVALRSIRVTDHHVVELAESYRERYTDEADWAAINNPLPLDPNHIVILGNAAARSWNFGLYLLDIRNGDRTKLMPAFDVSGVSEIGVDHHGTIRFRQRRFDRDELVEVRPDDQHPFVTVSKQPADVAMLSGDWEPLEFAADNDTLYFLQQEGARQRLRAYVSSQNRVAPSPDYILPGEFDGLAWSGDRSRLLGVYYTTDLPHVHWFDADREALQAKIDAALPGTVNRIISSTTDERVHIVVATSDRRPPVYFLLNLRPNAGRPAGLSLIGCANAKLSTAVLAAMKPVAYRARDGLTIHGYLTVPENYVAGTRVPLIIHPHGGPYGIRDEWGYDPEVQFLANRGYAVLQPNYRGSSGYGRDFLLAGRHEWGGKMQDDLTDGVKWAIAQGFADPKRVCILGASYGGYAALAGVTFTPDLYCCAVNYVGPSDLTLLMRHARPGDPDRVFQKFWIGDDSAYLHDHSPVNFVQNIRVPTLHAYGENDPRVDIQHWHRLRAQLIKYDKPFEYVDEGFEGHGYRHESTRVGFYRKVDTFLARYLGGTAEPAGTH